MTQSHKTTTNGDLFARLISLELKPRVKDIFSYHSRTTKDLLRRVIALGEEMAQSADVQNDAKSVEVWCACATPIFQGYWRSSVSEARKKAVLDDCYHTMLDIMVNNVAIPSGALEGLSAQDQHDLLVHSRCQFMDLLRLRGEQYIDAIVRYANFETEQPDPFAGELVNILIQNFFGSEDDSAIDRGELSTLVALPMILAFHDAMRG